MSRDNHNSTPRFQDPANEDELRATVPARVRATAQDGFEAAREAAATAAAVAGAAAGQARAGVESLRTSIEQADVPAIVRKPVPLGVLLGWAAAVGVVIYLMSRRRR